MFYDIHIFCCTNRRAEDNERGSCAAKGSESLRDYMKDQAKKISGAKLRVNASGCLDRCELGPVLVIYPEGVWYRYDTRADIDEILSQHVEKGRVVERLKV